MPKLMGMRIAGARSRRPRFTPAQVAQLREIIGSLREKQKTLPDGI